MRIKTFILALASLMWLAGQTVALGQSTNSVPSSAQAPPTVHVPDVKQQNNIPKILAGAVQRGQNPAATSEPAFRLPPGELKMKTNNFLPSQPAGTQRQSIQPLSSSQQMIQAAQPSTGIQSPRVAPDELKKHQQQIEERLRQIRKQVNASQPIPSSQPQSVPSAQPQSIPSTPLQNRVRRQPQSSSATASQFSFPPATANTFSAKTFEQKSFASQSTPRVSEAKPNAALVSNPTRSLGGAQAPLRQPAGSQSGLNPTAEIQVPKSPSAPSIRQTNFDANNSSRPINQIRQVSGESIAPRSESANSPGISMRSPSIEVQAFGPKSIGINKKANYQIVIQNNGRVDAEKLLIGLNIPSWIDIQSVSMTNGSKKVSNSAKDARLLWTVDRVPAGQKQTLSIDAIPRKPEMFDLGVEWTYLPRVAATTVAVTQPRLDMKISGPRDVLYGQKAIYHVTVRNPGTGVAENVHVKLPEALGGERAPLHSIEPGKEKNFQVELLARTAGELDLIATATANGELKVSASRPIIVRRAKLDISISGPPMKYAGGFGKYHVNIANNGDAMAQDVIAAVALPLGVKYLGGVEAAKTIDGGVRWNVGTLAPGDKRSYAFNCELNSAGELQMEAGVRGTGDLAASNACVTKVDTIADLVLAVQDPKGPLPTGDDVIYKINVTNRGTRAAQAVKIVMQFSDGIEPAKAEGHQHRVIPGQVVFEPIAQIEPGQSLVFYVTAKAQKAGTHIFRAQLTCSEADSREIAEGTTRFFGDQPEELLKRQRTANSNNSFAPIRK